MTNKLTRYHLCICVAGLVSLHVPGRESMAAQVTAAAPRIAAVQFALANGIAVDSSRVVVIPESDAVTYAMPPRASSAERLRDAQDIARLIGASVRVAKAGEVLDCFAIRCSVKGQNSVLTTEDPVPTECGYVVIVMLYSPQPGVPAQEQRPKTMAVNVKRAGNGWLGISRAVPARGGGGSTGC